MAYSDGATSFHMDCEKSQNPYRKNSTKWREWNTQFEAALAEFSAAIAAHNGPLSVPLVHL